MVLTGEAQVVDAGGQRGLLQTGLDWPYPVECWESPESSALEVGLARELPVGP